MDTIRVRNYRFNFEREPFLRPLQIKGASFSEKWTLVTQIESSRGTKATGVGGTAVLWSDPAVFFSHSEAGGNLVMSLLAEKAGKLVEGREFSTPIDMIQSIFPELHQFGKTITGLSNLSKTFTLNGLVSLDLALWKLWALEKGIESFDGLITPEWCCAFPHRHEKIIHVPTINYDYSLKDLIRLVDSGSFFLKIKLGQRGNPEEMLGKDCQRLSEIHRTLRNKRTPSAPEGKLYYYLDANGRYPDKSTLRRLIEHSIRIGMLEQVALVEEPFPEGVKEDLSDLPVRFAADESLHDVESVNERIDLGYRAMAMKPAGKTLSMSIQMAHAAYQRGIPCFVADNACVPLLVEWNKNFAARLSPLPGIPFPILESNGKQNYKNWEKMMEKHPLKGARWIEPQGGFYHLEESFYQTSGGIFLNPGHYQSLIEDPF